MKLTTRRLACVALLLSAPLALPAHAQNFKSSQIDWGDDTSKWANDGECDDPRFDGEGVAALTEDVDMFRDASDCRSVFEAGRATLVRVELAKRPTPPPAEPPAADPPASTEPAGETVQMMVPFGDDSSEWANDGECDDPRFEGEGIASGQRSFENAYADMSDCLRFWDAGTLTYNPDWRADLPPPPTAAEIDQIDFGADLSEYSRDGECDDPRFEGVGMAFEAVADNIRADSTDCRFLFMTGAIRLKQK